MSYHFYTKTKKLLRAALTVLYANSHKVLFLKFYIFIYPIKKYIATKIYNCDYVDKI